MVGELRAALPSPSHTAREVPRPGPTPPPSPVASLRKESGWGVLIPSWGMFYISGCWLQWVDQWEAECAEPGPEPQLPRPDI